MIRKFTCRNFRNIQAKDLEFEKINILIGPNNSGKSNFIKAITFFSEMLRGADEGNLKSAFLNAVARNGWKHLLNNEAQEGDTVDFVWELDMPREPVQYRFSFGVGDTVEQCNVVLEELTALNKSADKSPETFNYFRCHDTKIGQGHLSTAIQIGKKNRRPPFRLNSKDTIMTQFKDILLENQALYGSETVRIDVAGLLYEIQNYFEGFRVYTSAQFDTRKMREPVDAKNLDTLLKRDASNFVNIFNNYKSKDILWTGLFEKHMKELIHNLQKVDVANVYDKLIFNLAYGDRQYDLSDISEGTLKGLILNMLINMPMQEECTMLAIDEPETNLHPAWQKVVGQWIQSTDTFKQCFISTHSPDFLDEFTEEFRHGNVAVFVFDSGAQETIKKIKYEDIRDELGDWELGDLYRTNDPALGGWPW